MDAQPGAREFAVLDQLVGNFSGEVDRDGETDAAVHSTNERVYADDFAINVDERAAAVAGIDARVGLDEILVHHHQVGKNAASLGADMSKGHAVIQLERRSNRDGEFPDPSL